MGRRIRVFSFGMVLGCIVVYFAFYSGDKREFGSWMPGKRVMSSINNGFVTNDSMKCVLYCQGVADSDLTGMIEQAGVSFSKSQTKQINKLYVLESVTENKVEVELHFLIKDTLVNLVGIRSESFQATCDCD